MSKITYQTLLSKEVTEFCDLMGELFGKIERDLYKDLQKGKKLNDLKKSYQIKYGINARQFNSINIILKGKVASRKECYKNQIKQTELKIKGLQKTIESEKKKLAKLPLSCGYNQQSISGKVKFTLHQKQRKLATLKDRLVTLKQKKPSIVFGGKKLWYAQFNLKENGYSSHEEWLKNWTKSRNSQFTLVGSKDETNGNQNCQLLPNGTLKIRVPFCYESISSKYYLIENIKFSYGQSDVEYAHFNQQALTFRFVKKSDKWYLFLSSDSLVALILARRALRKKEGIPTSCTPLVQVDSSRHVWSFWNALSKKLKGVKRHSFFSVPHRKVEVKPLDELRCNRFNGKSLDTSITRRDSLSRVVNNSARLTQK